KNKFLGSWNFQQCQVLERRADKDQIVVLSVVQGKKTAAFYPDLPMEQSENAIEFVDGQYFANAGVVVQNKAALIFDGIVIAHARFRPTDECRVAENHPGLFLSGHKSIPEDSKRGRSHFALSRQARQC